MSLYSAGLIGAALARILDQAGLAAYGRLKYRNALIHCDEVRQNLRPAAFPASRGRARFK